MAKVKALRSLYHKGLLVRGTMGEMALADAKRLAAKGVVQIVEDDPVKDEPKADDAPKPVRRRKDD